MSQTVHRMPILVVGVVLLAALTVGVTVSHAQRVRPCEPDLEWSDPLSCRYGQAGLPVLPKPTPTVKSTLANPTANPGESILPFTYAQVITGPVPLYANVQAIASGVTTHTLAPGYVWVRVTGSVTVNNQLYYRIEKGSYLSAAVLTFPKPSRFEGVVNPTGFPFGWVLANTSLSAAAGSKPTKTAPSVLRYQIVHIYEEQKVENQVWYRIGEDQWIEQKQLGVVRPSPRPEKIAPDDQWIEVNLSEQTLMAYEGDRMVYATLISSGLPRWSTIKGLFRVWAKVRYGVMHGAEGRPDYYYLEAVPWTMYFHGDFAVHGAYWHDRFGYQHSHGCVNVPPLAAKWLFEWANPPLPENRNIMYTRPPTPGVWVWVHD